ncbi:hypothetical protein ACFVFS_40095 [Kitasatospora sp. NPDC057692]|uniref:hypothetical protein n=1 Tax=Kitasatospora sp. NPDC057692 TaxID=3346215 RepID=UPI00369B5887
MPLPRTPAAPAPPVARLVDAERALARLRSELRGRRGTSVLEVLGRERVEDSHERVLLFLLDPAASHGLGPGLLRHLLALAGLDEAAQDPAVARARVWRQVRADTSIPDLVVRAGAVTLVVELKVDASEGTDQTTRQADDFAHFPGVRFLFLTPAGTPPADPRFRPVALRELAGDLARLLAATPAAPSATGRSVAEDYLRTLENVMGSQADDNAYARFWFGDPDLIRASREGAERLLRQLPAHTAEAFRGLAPRLGEAVTVLPLDYTATGRAPGTGEAPRTYDETAVLFSRPEWLRPGARLGFGLGMRRAVGRQPGPSADRRGGRSPFVGVLCEDAALRRAVGAALGGTEWGRHWAWWDWADLSPQPAGAEFLPHAAATVARRVEALWESHVAVVDSLWAAHAPA